MLHLKTLDIHHHFFSKSSVDAQRKFFGPEVVERYKKSDPEGYKEAMALPDSIQRAEQLLIQMKEYNIDYVIPMFRFPEYDSGSFDIHKKFPSKFPGVVPFLNPEINSDPEIMENWVTKGAIGVKLYPAEWEKFTLSSPELLPFFKKMVELHLHPIIHVGVIKGSSAMWPCNPLEIRPWLTNKELKELKFIFAHFGAGFLREILMMAYANSKRIFVDTSGSNNWIDWSPWSDLTQVFEKSIKALSTSNILFGTDSNVNLLRPDVILRQRGILQDLVTRGVIKEEDREKILFNNAVELFHIKIS